MPVNEQFIEILYYIKVDRIKKKHFKNFALVQVLYKQRGSRICIILVTSNTTLTNSKHYFI